MVEREKSSARSQPGNAGPPPRADFDAAPSGAGDSDFLNAPSEEGRALGREIARLTDAEFAKNPELRPRCHDCAFRPGTEPNSIAGTLMTALKCAMEREPFYCHVIPADGRQRLCAGWEAMLNRGPATEAPWPFLEAAGDPMARCIPEPQSAPGDGAERAHAPLPGITSKDAS